MLMMIVARSYLFHAVANHMLPGYIALWLCQLCCTALTHILLGHTYILSDHNRPQTACLLMPYLEYYEFNVSIYI